MNESSEGHLMRICVITTVHSPKDIRIRKELETLRKSGHDVSFVAPEGEFPLTGIHYIPIRRHSGRMKRFLHSSKEALRRSLEVNADVYHFHDPELIPLGFKLKRAGKKVVYDIHEEYPSVILMKNWIPRALRRFVAKFADNYERKAVSKFDGIVVVVPDQLERFPDVKRFAVLPNYPDVDYLESKRSSSTEGVVRFVYSGSIDIDRSIVEMIQAFMLLRKDYNIELNLLGPIFDSELKRMISESARSCDGLNYMGFMSYEEAVECVAQNDIGLMVMHRGRSKEISSPLKMFEYLTLGLPIIASDFEKWHEILDERPCALFVDPDSPEDISAKMETLIINTDLRAKMKENAKLISTKYSWKSVEERLLKLYSSISQDGPELSK